MFILRKFSLKRISTNILCKNYKKHLVKFFRIKGLDIKASLATPNREKATQGNSKIFKRKVIILIFHAN